MHQSLIQHSINFSIVELSIYYGYYIITLEYKLKINKLKQSINQSIIKTKNLSKKMYIFFCVGGSKGRMYFILQSFFHKALFINIASHKANKQHKKQQHQVILQAIISYYHHVINAAIPTCHVEISLIQLYNQLSTISTSIFHPLNKATMLST